MKLSLNLEDDSHQNPVLKAKIPITIFNQPFTTTLNTPPITTNFPQHLSCSVSTNFSCGPCLKISYSPAPSTTVNPFSISLKSGLGIFGSPRNSPLIFSANFSVSSSFPPTLIPTFSLHFKPQFGHFSLKKSTSSNPNLGQISQSRHAASESRSDFGTTSNNESVKGVVSEVPLGDSWQELKLEPVISKEESEFSTKPCHNSDPSCSLGFHPNGAAGFVPDRPMMFKDGRKDGFLTGIAVRAGTMLPLTKRVAINLRWSVNLLADSVMSSDSRSKMPYLKLNKIGIERVEEVKEMNKNVNEGSNVGDLELLKGIFLWMRRDLDVLEEENRDIKQCLQEIRLGVSMRNCSGEIHSFGKKAIKNSSESLGKFEKWKSKKNGEGKGQKELKEPLNQVVDVESELQRAIKAASA